MRIDIITLFPRMFEGFLGESILKRAQQKKLVTFSVINLRDFSTDKHRKVDDRPFGGGPGMVIGVEPVCRALESMSRKKEKKRIILLTPQGKKFDQPAARRLARQRHLVLLCGHYEGFDERIKKWVDEEISIGDFVLTGGELPAMAVADAVVRLIPGVLGDENSAVAESFDNGLLEYPQYTRPAGFRGMNVPKILLSGNHKAVEEWRKQQALARTKKRRPDLLKGVS
ncbi:MAG: tRNA (guanosine(37)-N1)-methyltransferase TrmD [Candidatus Omnitrophica bacterium]|nr:tRNA (guanosine(37)-N1)-methyltransferase TrmD [Candidatus Omnitrophota bacterium]